MQKFLLKDYSGYINDKSLLTEADLGNIKNGALVIAGKVHEAEILNHNNRIYTRETLLREVNNYQKLIKARRSVGELDHPDRPIIEFGSVSHLFTEVWWEGNKVLAKIEILKNIPKGQILAEMHSYGIPIGMSSRGLGSVEKVRGKNYVSDDYQLICWDAVTDPSTPNAFADKTISESKYKEFIKQNEEKYYKVEKENLLDDLFVSNNKTRIDIWSF